MWADLVGYSSTFTGTTYTVESVAPGVSYTFRVRAQNTHGWSDWSEPYTTILSASAPAKMAAVTVAEGVASSTAVLVSFTAPDARGTPITGY